MAIKIGANFAYNGKLPNFERDSFKTKAAMKAFAENSINEGHLSYCEEDGKVYQYKSANTVDATTGKWRLFKTDIVVDSALNGTSKNPIQNKAVFEALKLKADAAVLAAYQPKYKADYVATKDFNYSELPADVESIDLNGYTMTTNENITISSKKFYNGTIQLDAGNQTDACKFYHVNIDALSIYEDIDSSYEYCTINRMNVISATSIKFSAVSDTNFSGIETVIFTIIEYSTFSFGSGEFFFGKSVIIDDSLYKTCYIKNDKPVDKGYEFNIDIPTIPGNAPSCEAVKTALQLKADKTQLNGLATKTELNGKADASALNNYVTTTTANSTYAKKSDITNIYKFKGTKTNYADLPTTNRVTGDVWNITNADAEHGIKAGDNVAWNGTAWDNLSGTVDLSAYVTKDSVAIDLAKKVDIAAPKYISFGNKDTNIKILSIKIPNLQYQTVYLKCALASRYYNTDIIIDVNTDTTPYRFDIIKSATNTAVWDTKGNLYYFFDEVNDNLELYYNLVGYDSIAVKVISTGGTIKFTYNTDIEKVDTIPENAILVEDRNYGNKNLFFATPYSDRGVAKLRAIDITDLPDLSSKYATKKKAFTKDTVSTEPGQFVAGPINTRGNISLRKIDISDIPDLRSKYQKLDSNGYQEKAKVAGLIVKHGNTGDTGSGYLIAEVDQSVGGQMGPDWYYATDGTLQDIKTKIPKVVLDDTVSTTSDNGVKNSVITKYVDGKVTTINDGIADLRNKVNAMPKAVILTQAAYNALTTRDPNTIYYING